MLRLARVCGAEPPAKRSPAWLNASIDLGSPRHICGEPVLAPQQGGTLLRPGAVVHALKRAEGVVGSLFSVPAASTGDAVEPV